MKNFIGLMSLIAFVFPGTATCGNPFKSIQGKAIPPATTLTPEVVPDPERPPLQRWPVEQYILMGVLVTKNNNLEQGGIAILRTPPPHAQTYLVRSGDLLGDKDGFIKDIDVVGVIVHLPWGEKSNSPEEIKLVVRNKGLKKQNE